MGDDLFDQVGSETALALFGHRGPSPLLPFDPRQSFGHQFPPDVDASVFAAESAVFGRVGRQFVERQPERQRIVGRKFHRRTLADNGMRLVMRIGREFGRHDRCDRRGAPFGLREQVVGRGKRPDPPVQPVRKGLDVLCPSPGQRHDRQHVRKRVLDAMIEFAGQGIADRVLFREPVQRSLVLQRLFGQQPRHQHEQAGDRQSEQHRGHRKRRQS